MLPVLTISGRGGLGGPSSYGDLGGDSMSAPFLSTSGVAGRSSISNVIGLRDLDDLSAALLGAGPGPYLCSMFSCFLWYSGICPGDRDM